MSELIAPAPPAGNREGQIFPDSDTRRLVDGDVSALDQQQLRQARSGIYARKGRRFKNEEPRAHFRQFSLTRVEQANVALLCAAERSR
jgi:YARHG domain